MSATPQFTEVLWQQLFAFWVGLDLIAWGKGPVVEASFYYCFYGVLLHEVLTRKDLDEVSSSAAPLAIKPEDQGRVVFIVVVLVDVAQRVEVFMGVFVDNLDQQPGVKLVRRFEFLLDQQRFFLVSLSALRFEI